MKSYLDSKTEALHLYQGLTEDKKNLEATYQGKEYLYLGEAFTKDKGSLFKLGRGLALTVEIFFTILSFGVLYAIKPFNALMHRHWKECKKGQELVSIYVIDKLARQSISVEPLLIEPKWPDRRASKVDEDDLEKLPHDLRKIVYDFLSPIDRRNVAQVSLSKYETIKKDPLFNLKFYSY